ncbi:hypothetical protein ACSBR2_024628 [Camellia fascicularis]
MVHKKPLLAQPAFYSHLRPAHLSASKIAHAKITHLPNSSVLQFLSLYISAHSYETFFTHLSLLCELVLRVTNHQFWHWSILTDYLYFSDLSSLWN